MIKGFWGKKIGMTQIFSDNKAVPVTVIDVSSWFVTNVRTEERDGYNAVQVGRVRKRYEGQAFDKEWLKKTKVYFGNLKEIRTNEPVENMEIGQEVDFHMNFEQGNSVDVRGITKGCGFAGVVRRHNYSGGRGSHGCTMGRRTGSIGFMCKTGKVIKGKAMPGHMGVDQRVAENLEVMKVDQDPKIVVVKGSVPGKAGSLVFVCDRVKA